VKGSTVSRRVSEFVGVALFAAALICIVALASYEPKDPVWFFSTGVNQAPANFAGRVGAFVAELSFQLVGYAAYLIPALLVVIGWHYFWCRTLEAAGTKATGAMLLVACISTFLSLIVGTIDISGKAFRGGGYVGDFLATELADYLNRTGSIIVILTLMFLSVIVSTQFSFGRLFAWLFRVGRDLAGRALVTFREWQDERRREKQRAEVIAKHTKKAGAAPADAASPGVDAVAAARLARKRAAAEEAEEPAPRGAAPVFAAIPPGATRADPPNPPQVSD
jgi:S-DNA-T family DNA segregation ATPase FtsK/SpoIIIE